MDLLNPGLVGRAGGGGGGGRGGAEPFKTGEDGRWIIPEDESSDDEGMRGAPRKGATSGVSGSSADDGLTFGRGIHRDRAVAGPGFAASFGARKMKKGTSSEGAHLPAPSNLPLIFLLHQHCHSSFYAIKFATHVRALSV